MTIGYLFSKEPEPAEEESLEIVSIDYLKKKSEAIIHWAATYNKEVMSMQ
jgi:hypothetical protein